MGPAATDEVPDEHRREGPVREGAPPGAVLLRPALSVARSAQRRGRHALPEAPAGEVVSTPTTPTDVAAKFTRAGDLKLAVELAASQLGMATARVSVTAALSRAGDDPVSEMEARKEMREKQR